MKNPQPKLSIVMPVRNEGVNIPVSLKILSAVVEVPHEILVVYDEPHDDSVPAVKKMQGNFPQVHLVHNTLGRGVAQAIRAGVAQAKGEYILIFAVDEVGPVMAIEDMLTLMDSGCDLVSSTRYAHGGRRLGGSLSGRIFSSTGNKLFHIIAGSCLTDSTTGIKMFRKSIFSKVRLEGRPVGWAVVYELAMKTQAAGFQLGEVPIVSIDRLYGGKSTFALMPWLSEYFRWFMWGVRHLRNVPRKKIWVRIPKTGMAAH